MSSEGKIKVLKKKKVMGELVADCIDNTAPVHKILEDLPHKNLQAYSLYKYILKQRRTTRSYLLNLHFALPGHPLKALGEDWDGQFDTSFFKPFCHKSFPPKMINNIRNVDKSDPVTDYLKLKQDWIRVCRNLRQTAVLGKMMEKYKKLNDDVVQCPKHLVDIAAHLDSDPDPYFNSSYNWYYAGSGNTQLVCINGIDYLLHSEFNCVYLTEFNRSEGVISPDSVAKFNCGNSNIFETIYSSQNIVSLRTRNKIFILKVVTEDTIRFEKLKEMESEMPFTGISFDSYHKNILYVTTLGNNMSIVNLDRMNKKIVNLITKLKRFVDNWNTVISSDSSFYTHVSSTSISLYDKRSDNVDYLWSSIRTVTDEMACNDISAARQSEIAPTLYVGTDHHLFLFDLRYSDYQKVAPVQRWTHGMQCQPIYISKCNFELEKDLICLSSQWCEDMCVIANSNKYRTDMDVCNLMIPYRPPSILKALEGARANKLCYNLYNPIDSRLNTAITGCVIFEQAEKYDVLLQNSLGDISCHTIFPEHLETFIVDDSLNKLHEWSETYKLPSKDFEVSSVVDVADIWKNLKKVHESDLAAGPKENDENTLREKEIFDVFEKEDLDSGLLEVWLKEPGDNTVGESSTTLNLHYSDSE